MKNCPKCNANLPDDSDFCTNCGSKISEIQNNSAGKKKGSKTIKVLLIIIAVLLAIGIAVGAYFIFKDNNSSADQNNNIVSEEDDKDSDDEDKNNDKDPDIEIEPDEDVDVDVDITKDGELVIGVSGPLTGLASMYGNSVLNGACLAVDEINAAGGINGIKLELISADDEADSGEKAVSAYNSLKDQGMQIFLGTVTSGSCLAVIE